MPVWSKSLLENQARFCACFEQSVPWCLGNATIEFGFTFETSTWHNKNISQMQRTEKYSQCSSALASLSK